MALRNHFEAYSRLQQVTLTLGKGLAAATPSLGHYVMWHFKVYQLEEGWATLCIPFGIAEDWAQLAIRRKKGGALITSHIQTARHWDIIEALVRGDLYWAVDSAHIGAKVEGSHPLMRCSYSDNHPCLDNYNPPLDYNPPLVHLVAYRETLDRGHPSGLL